MESQYITQWVMPGVSEQIPPGAEEEIRSQAQHPSYSEALSYTFLKFICFPPPVPRKNAATGHPRKPSPLPQVRASYVRRYIA